MLIGFPVQALELSGPVTLSDADTFRIGGQVIRLNGIDAFEDGQKCKGASGEYRCGIEGLKLLKALTLDGASCAGSEFDPYERLIARCRNAAGADLGAELVSAGWALAYRKFSTAYVEQEEAAKRSKRGAWAGSFATPWYWRSERWTSAKQEAPEGCPIKGNINRAGVRIYHAPWSRWYSRTRIKETAGERWFCDEAEALAAGWRAPLR